MPLLKYSCINTPGQVTLLKYLSITTPGQGGPPEILLGQVQLPLAHLVTDIADICLLAVLGDMAGLGALVAAVLLLGTLPGEVTVSGGVGVQGVGCCMQEGAVCSVQ